MLIHTRANKHYPAIEWELGDQYDQHDHTSAHFVEGESEDGRQWRGTAEVCGDDAEVIEIEELITVK